MRLCKNCKEWCWGHSTECAVTTIFIYINSTDELWLCTIAEATCPNLKKNQPNKRNHPKKQKTEQLKAMLKSLISSHLAKCLTLHQNHLWLAVAAVFSTTALPHHCCKDYPLIWLWWNFKAFFTNRIRTYLVLDTDKHYELLKQFITIVICWEVSTFRLFLCFICSV